MELISVPALKRKEVDFVTTIGLDVSDISRPVEDGVGGIEAYIRELDDSNREYQTLSQVPYLFDLTLDELEALSPLLTKLTVTSFDGRELSTPKEMVFVKGRIAGIVQEEGAGSKFFYKEEGNPDLVEYVVSDAVADVIGAPIDGDSIYTGSGVVPAGVVATLTDQITFNGGQVSINEPSIGNQTLFVKALVSHDEVLQLSNDTGAAIFTKHRDGRLNLNGAVAATGNAIDALFDASIVSGGTKRGLDFRFNNIDSTNGAGYRWRTEAAAAGNTNLIGGSHIVTGGAATAEAIGMVINVSGASKNYSLQLQDGTEGAVGHVLASVDANGRTQWVDPNTLIDGGIYGGNGTVPSSTVATLTDTLDFQGGDITIDGQFAVNTGISASQMMRVSDIATDPSGITTTLRVYQNNTNIVTSAIGVEFNTVATWGNQTVYGFLSSMTGATNNGRYYAGYFAANGGGTGGGVTTNIAIATPANQGTWLLGTLTYDATALFRMDSTTQGFLPPRMTTAEKNAIGSPSEGLVVYDTDLNDIHYYDGATWVGTGGGTDGNGIYTGSDSLSGDTTVTMGTNDLTFSMTSGYIGLNASGAKPINGGELLVIETASEEYGWVHTDGSAIFTTYIGEKSPGTDAGWIGMESAHSLVIYGYNAGSYGAYICYDEDPANLYWGLNTDSPTTEWDIDGDLRVRGLSTASITQTDASGNIAVGTWEFSGDDIVPLTDGSNIGSPTNGVGTIYMSSAIDYGSNLEFINSGTKMTLTTAGYLGIGSVPSNNLLELTNAAGVRQLKLAFNSNNNVEFTHNGFAFLNTQSQGRNYFKWSVNPSGGGDTELMRHTGTTGDFHIVTGGLVVGAGSTTSDTALNDGIHAFVDTSDLALNSGVNDIAMTLRNKDNTNGNGVFFNFQDASPNGLGKFGIIFTDHTTNTADFAWGVGVGGNTQAMRLTSGGDLMVGDRTTADARLHVAGDTEPQVRISNDANNNYITLNQRGHKNLVTTAPTLNFYSWEYSGSEKMRLNNDGNLLLNTTSDGASAVGNVVVGEGTAPSGAVANTFHAWAAEVGGGDTTVVAHFMDDAGNVYKLTKSAAYTPTNVSNDRSYDADSTTVDELADVLGTLISDLQATGIIG